MADLRIVMVTGQEVIFRDVQSSERAGVEKALERGTPIRVMEEGRWLVLNPAHVVMVADIRADEPEASASVPSDERCSTCRGRGTIVRVENRIKTERTCNACHGSGKAWVSHGTGGDPIAGVGAPE